MRFDSSRKLGASTADEQEVRLLYRHVLDGWNQQSARAFATPFAGSEEVIGFDGSQMIGRAEIASMFGRIFADHRTARYISTGYQSHPFSKETVFTLQFCRCDPSFPAFFPESGMRQEGIDCLDHEGLSICSEVQSTFFQSNPSSPALLLDESEAILPLC